jgi:AcrR family transcriptional regulator
MPRDVNRPRPYDSTRRREQADLTRARIIDAAQRLFEEQGYVATSMAAIAKEAGVALKTVYVSLETKPGVLRALWHRLLRGDDEPVPVWQRDWYREVIEEPDPQRQLRLNARNARAARERFGRLLEVIRAAASADPEIGALWESIQTEFRENQHAIVESLQAKRALKKGLDTERATDILWTLNHPTLYQLLVAERGWTAAEYEDWLGAIFCSQLLRS